MSFSRKAAFAPTFKRNCKDDANRSNTPTTQPDLYADRWLGICFRGAVAGRLEKARNRNRSGDESLAAIWIEADAKTDRMVLIHSIGHASDWMDVNQNGKA